ncbi:MAG TPA: hypothetical protein VGV89_00895 [Thermoplasmata archaeon]|nr:hypothetical protein [Thermoplasmata archaeon]
MSIVARTSPSFWGLVAQTSTSRGILTDSKLDSYLAATPFTWFRYTMQTDQCNISANVVYTDSGGKISPCGFNISAFKTWCYSRTPHCQAIVDLPGENNNPVEDLVMARYIVGQVGFQPNYWSIGNEPMLWTHFGIPWSKWTSSDRSTPTPLEYARDVQRAILAVRSVDPGARFIGIQADCECSPTWFQQVVKVDGPNISAIAYHTYPSTALATRETLPQFYHPLASSANLLTSYSTVRSSIRGWCARCSTLPIFVTEYNAGPGWAPSNWGGTYANAVFLAASTVQALRANISMLTVFNLQTYASHPYGYSLLNGNDVPGPPALLYSTLLDHLAIGTVLRTPVATTLSNVWSVLSVDSSTASLLIVNANLAQALPLALGKLLPVGALPTVYSWKPGQPLPALSHPLLSLGLTVPSQGIVLINFAAKLLGPLGPAPAAVAPTAATSAVGAGAVLAVPERRVVY